MIEQLSYIGFTSPEHEAWNTFGPNVLGLELVDPGADGAVRLRMDDANYRIAIHPGDENDIAYLGWGVSSPREVASIAKTLRDAGVEVTQESPELAAERGVFDLISFHDPSGLRSEVSWGQLTLPTQFRPGRAMTGFVTGKGGLGHAVILAPNLEEAEAFYVDLLGFSMTDQINMTEAGPRIRFYNCNQRHHSLAMVEVPGIRGFHHMMLEVESLDDVGNALDLIRHGAGGELAMTIGRHTNDKMTSFYVQTPSAFEIEYGYGGKVLEEDEQIPRFYNSLSIWGHHPPNGDLLPPAIVHVLDEKVAPPPPASTPDSSADQLTGASL